GTQIETFFHAFPFLSIFLDTSIGILFLKKLKLQLKFPYSYGNIFPRPEASGAKWNPSGLGDSLKQFT
ncbi:MAG: hypothetical protein ACI3XG_07695, partial [Faecousia sp.]